jgi:uncharacterized membrane protein
MNKTALLLASAASLALTAPAFAADKETFKSETKIEKDSKGNYEAKTETTKTDAAGTTTSMEKKVDIDVDSKGNVDKTVKTEEVVDPKGLMNKTKVKTTDTATTNADGTVDSTHKKVVNGKTVEEEKVKH